MGKHKHTWAEAKKLCRLNQNDIAMAKKLGFQPDKLVRARPDPKQKWKLPVKYWVRELHLERFGFVLGEKAVPETPAATPEYDEEAVRIFGEQLYWEDYWDRNQEYCAEKQRAGTQKPAVTVTPAPVRESIQDLPTDDDRDLPF
jgi:hypothetical protein